MTILNGRKLEILLMTILMTCVFNEKAYLTFFSGLDQLDRTSSSKNSKEAVCAGYPLYESDENSRALFCQRTSSIDNLKVKPVGTGNVWPYIFNAINAEEKYKGFKGLKDDSTFLEFDKLTSEKSLPTIGDKVKAVKSFELPLNLWEGANKLHEVLMAFPLIGSSNPSEVILNPILRKKFEAATKDDKKSMDPRYPYAFWLYYDASNGERQIHLKQIKLDQEMPKVNIEHKMSSYISWFDMYTNPKPFNFQIKYEYRFEHILDRIDPQKAIPTFELYRFDSGSDMNTLTFSDYSGSGIQTLSYKTENLACDKNFSSIVILSTIDLLPTSKVVVETTSNSDQVIIAINFEGANQFIGRFESEKIYKEVISSEGKVSIYYLIEKVSHEPKTEGMVKLIEKIRAESKVHQCKLDEVLGAQLIEEPDYKYFFCIKPVSNNFIANFVGKFTAPVCSIVDFIKDSSKIKPKFKVITKQGIIFYTEVNEDGSQLCSDGLSVYYVEFEIGKWLSIDRTTSEITLSSFYGTHETKSQIRI